MPERKRKLSLKNLAMWAPKTKSTSQARIKPEIFVNFRPEPELNPKSPARLTTPGGGQQLPLNSGRKTFKSQKLKNFMNKAITSVII